MFIYRFAFYHLAVIKLLDEIVWKKIESPQWKLFVSGKYSEKITYFLVMVNDN